MKKEDKTLSSLTDVVDESIDKWLEILIKKQEWPTLVNEVGILAGDGGCVRGLCRMDSESRR